MKLLYYLFPCLKKSVMEINFKKLKRYSKKIKRQDRLEERRDIRNWIKSEN